MKRTRGCCYQSLRPKTALTRLTLTLVHSLPILTVNINGNGNHGYIWNSTIIHIYGSYINTSLSRSSSCQKFLFWNSQIQATCCPMATNMATWFFSKMDQPLFTGQQNDVEQSVKHGICTKIWFSCRRPVLFAPKSGATRTTFESEDGGGKVKCQTSFDMLSQNRWRRCITVTWVVICQGCSYFNATSIYNSRPPDT